MWVADVHLPHLLTFPLFLEEIFCLFHTSTAKLEYALNAHFQPSPIRGREKKQSLTKYLPSFSFSNVTRYLHDYSLIFVHWTCFFDRYHVIGCLFKYASNLAHESKYLLRTSIPIYLFITHTIFLFQRIEKKSTLVSTLDCIFFFEPLFFVKHYLDSSGFMHIKKGKKKRWYCVLCENKRR